MLRHYPSTRCGLASQPRQEHLAESLFPIPRSPGARASMPFDHLNPLRFLPHLFVRNLPIRFVPAAALAAALILGAAPATAARGPENIADVAEQVIDRSEERRVG